MNYSLWVVVAQLGRCSKSQIYQLFIEYLFFVLNAMLDSGDIKMNKILSYLVISWMSPVHLHKKLAVSGT